jgi:hypothetical protein
MAMKTHEADFLTVQIWKKIDVSLAQISFPATAGILDSKDIKMNRNSLNKIAVLTNRTHFCNK